MDNPVYYGVATYCNSYDYCNKETVVRLGYIPEKYIENVKRKLDALLYNSMLDWIIWESFEFKICFYDDLTVDQKAELNRKDSSEAWLELLKEINEIVESYVILERQEQARFERPVQTALVPLTSNTNFPAVQVVQRDIIWQDTRPAFVAEGGTAPNSDELALVTAGNTTQLLSQNNGIRKTVNGIDKKVDGVNKKVDEVLTLLQNSQGQAPAIDDRDEYYLSIPNHDERRYIMLKIDKIPASSISKWENKYRDKISTPLNPLPSTGEQAIYASVRRYRIALENKQEQEQRPKQE